MGGGISCDIMILLADITCTWYNSEEERCGTSLLNDLAILSIYPFDGLTWKCETCRAYFQLIMYAFHDDMKVDVGVLAPAVHISLPFYVVGLL